MCPVYYFNIKINLDIYNYLGLFFIKYYNDLCKVKYDVEGPVALPDEK